MWHVVHCHWIWSSMAMMSPLSSKPDVLVESTLSSSAVTSSAGFQPQSQPSRSRPLQILWIFPRLHFVAFPAAACNSDWLVQIIIVVSMSSFLSLDGWSNFFILLSDWWYKSLQQEIWGIDVSRGSTLPFVPYPYRLVLISISLTLPVYCRVFTFYNGYYFLISKTHVWAEATSSQSPH